MKKENILVVDDEDDILELVRYNLAKEGYNVSCAISGEHALAMINSDMPDLIVLDLMLPGSDGLEVTRRLKRDPKTRHIPIVMLTAKGEETDIVTGLELGADDYVTKPFSPRVLTARIRSILRRRIMETESPEQGKIIRVHDIEIDPGRYKVSLPDGQIELTSSEFQLLCFLAKRPGWVFTRTQIVDAIRGDNYAVTDRSIDVQIVGLRRKLKSCGHYIETVRGVGYRFKE